MQTCEATPYSGKKVKMSGYIKTENVKEQTALWMRIDSTENRGLKYFDNMRNRPINGTTDWAKYKITLDVPENSYTLNFGVLLVGSGKVWLDNVNFEIVGKSSEKFDEQITDKKAYPLPGRPEKLDFQN